MFGWKATLAAIGFGFSGVSAALLVLWSGQAHPWLRAWSVGRDTTPEILTTAERAYAQGDYHTAITLIQPLAERGDPKAEVALGFIFSDGTGIEKNYGEALKWYHKAANQGDAEGQYNLGEMYRLGEGVILDTSEALMASYGRSPE